MTNRTQCKQPIKDTGNVPKTWTLDESWICAQGSQEINNENVLCKGDGGGSLVCQEQGTNR